jgi:hypothetical protein
MLQDKNLSSSKTKWFPNSGSDILSLLCTFTLHEILLGRCHTINQSIIYNSIFNSLCLICIILIQHIFLKCSLSDCIQIKLVIGDTIRITGTCVIIWLIHSFIVFNPTFSNISTISWRPVLVVEETGIPWENHRPWASNW